MDREALYREAVLLFTIIKLLNQNLLFLLPAVRQIAWHETFLKTLQNPGSHLESTQWVIISVLK